MLPAPRRLPDAGFVRADRVRPDHVPVERSQQQSYPQGQAQSDDADMEMRIQRLESQLRQLTGQNEELQYRNASSRIGCASLAPRRPRRVASPRWRSPTWPLPRLKFSPARRRGNRAIRNKPIRNKPIRSRRPRQQGYPQAQPGYDQQPQSPPAPIVQDPAAPPAGGRRRGDAFDPSQNPKRPGRAARARGGQMPMSAEAPGGRAPGEPLNLGGSARSRWRRLAAARCSRTAAARPRAWRQRRADHAAPSATSKDEFDLGIGYMQRKDYALAEET